MILISSCLVGQKVRYDGKAQLKTELSRLVESGEAIYGCPELLGGLRVPREPAEIVGGDGFDCLDGIAKVMTITGKDETEAFILGAYNTLKILKEKKIDRVILKANSPSCGSKYIYDGSFTGQKKVGVGVTTALLSRNGIDVISEDDFINEN